MILDDSILELTVPVATNEPVEDLEYSTWISTGEDYIPAVNLKCVDNIPAGMYACAFMDRDYHLTPIPINSDELFIFSDSYQESILSEIKQFWDKKELYKQYNLCHKRGILLEGGPGTGKSSLITQVIQHIIELNGVVFIVRNANEFQFLPIVLKSIFRKIESERPIITIIEDVDKLIENLGGDQILLDFMDGKQSINNHLIILTSNNTSDLSDALLRPSRIDLRYRLDNPNDSVRREYFQYKGISEEKLDEYVTLTKNLSIADLKEVFIATVILDKPIEQVIKDIKNPLQKRDYLIQSHKITGF